MQILHPFAGSIQQYSEQVSDGCRYRPLRCPLCHAKCPLVAHGFYSRTLVDLDFDGLIRIRRYLCRFCCRTVSLLPEFALPYLRFSVSVISRFLLARLLHGCSLKTSAEAAGQHAMLYQRGQFWIRRFRLGQQLPHFLPQRAFILLHARIAHRFVLGGIGFHFRAIERHAAELYGTRFQRQSQRLLKKPLQRLVMNLAEIRNGTEVGLVVCRQNAERHVLDKPLLNLPRRENPDAVCVNQDLRHHPRVIRRLAAIFLFVERYDVPKIHFIDDIAHKVDQVVFRKPVLQAWRQQKQLVWTVGSESFCHAQ